MASATTCWPRSRSTWRHRACGCGRARSWTRPSSPPQRRTKNRAQQRDPEMHQAKKGNQWYFGMKAHIGVDAHTGLVHSLATTAANVADVTQVPQLLHGSETRVWGDAGYQGVDRRPEHQGRAMDWQVALPGRAAAPLATGQCGRAGGAAQSGDPGEGGASVPVREAPLRLRDGAVSGPGEEPQPALPVIWAGESVAGGVPWRACGGRYQHPGDQGRRLFRAFLAMRQDQRRSGGSKTKPWNSARRSGERPA